MQSRQLTPATRGFLGGYGGGGDPISQIRQQIDEMFSHFGFSPSLLRGGMTGPGTGSGGGVTGGHIGFPVDITETNEGYTVIAELPGLQQNDVDVTVSGNTLTIRGQKQSQHAQQQGQGGQGQNLLVQERSYGQVQRSFHLPEGTNPDQIKGDFNNGVLTLLIPKSQEHQQQKKVQISGGR